MRCSITRALALAALAALAGCTNVFLQPDRALHDRPERVGAKWEELRFESADGTGLTALWFPAQGGPSKGVIVQFHGNGENMTSHYLFVYWLALEGWDVMAWDYRGYGASEGDKSIRGAISDGTAALNAARAKAPGKPLVVVGQSLGGALALAALEKDGGEGVKAMIIDSSFASYRRLAREKLGLVWLTWPLQWPLSFLISDRHKPEKLAAKRKPIPLLMLHSTRDPIVPYRHGKRLFDAAAGPKELWTIEGNGHTEALFAKGAEYRPKIRDWLSAAVQPAK